MPDDYQFFEQQIAGRDNQIYDYAPIIDSTGDFRRLEGIDVAIRAIRTLLMTPLGHYPFDPNFGSLLFEKVFNMADEISAKEIEFEVKERINQFEDRITVESVNTTYASNGKTIVVEVHILREGIPGTLSVFVDEQHSMFGLEDSITAQLEG